MGATWGGVWIGLVALLPLAVYAAVWIWPTRQVWSPRVVPADCFRLVTGVLFAGAVHPSLGLLAGLSAFWWAMFALGRSDESQTLVYRWGTPRLAGGTLWPLVAMGIWMGLQVPSWAFQGALWLALGVGVLQVAMGVIQWRQWPRLRSWVLATRAGMIHGTLGHRTGYGIYLAMLAPLALGLVPWPWHWALVGTLSVGVLLSNSLVAGLAMTVGVLWMAPSLWTGAVVFFFLGALYRFGPSAWLRWQTPLADRDLRPGHWGRWYALTGIVKPWKGRIAVWRATLPRCGTWPEWLIGHGAGAFQLDARKWMSHAGLREVYSEAHNDYLESFYEYGVVGAVALGLWLWSVWPSFTGGNLFVGMLLTAGTAMTLNFPLRVAPTATLALVAAIGLMR